MEGGGIEVAGLEKITYHEEKGGEKRDSQSPPGLALEYLRMAQDQPFELVRGGRGGGEV